MGKRKIPKKIIETESVRNVTFKKRQLGLVKKVDELSVLCGVDVLLIYFGPPPKHELHVFSNKPEDAVLTRYLNLPEDKRRKGAEDTALDLELFLAKLKGNELKAKGGLKAKEEVDKPAEREAKKAKIDDNNLVETSNPQQPQHQDQFYPNAKLNDIDAALEAGTSSQGAVQRMMLQNSMQHLQIQSPNIQNQHPTCGAGPLNNNQFANCAYGFEFPQHGNMQNTNGMTTSTPYQGNQAQMCGQQNYTHANDPGQDPSQGFHGLPSTQHNIAKTSSQEEIERWLEEICSSEQTPTPAYPGFPDSHSALPTMPPSNSNDFVYENPRDLTCGTYPQEYMNDLMNNMSLAHNNVCIDQTPTTPLYTQANDQQATQADHDLPNGFHYQAELSDFEGSPFYETQEIFPLETNPNLFQDYGQYSNESWLDEPIFDTSAEGVTYDAQIPQANGDYNDVNMEPLQTNDDPTPPR